MLQLHFMLKFHHVFVEKYVIALSYSIEISGPVGAFPSNARLTAEYEGGIQRRRRIDL